MGQKLRVITTLFDHAQSRAHDTCHQRSGRLREFVGEFLSNAIRSREISCQCGSVVEVDMTDSRIHGERSAEDCIVGIRCKRRVEALIGLVVRRWDGVVDPRIDNAIDGRGAVHNKYVIIGAIDLEKITLSHAIEI